MNFIDARSMILDRFTWLLNIPLRPMDQPAINLFGIAIWLILQKNIKSLLNYEVIMVLFKFYAKRDAN